jgi:cellulose synthase/poly-beta-1,6-N-acetylglucosamine synthase-like glycosyltransferase
MVNIKSISIVIPTVRICDNTFNNLLSVALSLSIFDGVKELILAVDRKVGKTDFLRVFAAEYPFVRLLEVGIGIGSSSARLLAIKETKHEVILFTDDDCVVPLDWVVIMYQKIMKYGVVTGNLGALQAENTYSLIDAYIDQLRIRSVDECGNVKYLSFPNFGIQRKYLPEEPFLANPLNTTEDIDLACRLRLKGIQIHFNESIIVWTKYPTTLISLLGRKSKHAQGVAFLRSHFSFQNCNRLGLAETPLQMLFRWGRLSLRSPLIPIQKLYMFMANAVYCVALAYYDNKFRTSEQKIWR